MKLRLLTVGPTTTPWLREGIGVYADRVGRYVPFELTALPDVRGSKSLPQERQKELEGKMILDAVGAGDVLVLLDEHGREYTSRELAAWLQKRMAAGGAKGLTFVVGGPYGFSDAVHARADFKLSLSALTFPHELVRLLFVEQLYRAFTILHNTPYHHD